MKKTDQQSEILQRLRCALGHLKGVINMVESEQPCGQVLHQICAVQGALRQVGLRMVSFQVQESKTIIFDATDPETRIAELMRLLQLHQEMTRTPFINYEVSQ